VVVPAKSYANDAGITRAKVLTDAATDCGETFDATTATGVLGPQWHRENAPASNALHLIAPRAWYVGEDGVTRLGARQTRQYTGSAARVAADLAQSRVVLAANDVSELLPGVVVDGITAVDVCHELDGDKLRTTIWGAQSVGGALARVVDALTAKYRYAATYEYRVVTPSGERLNLQPVRVSTGMHDLQRVPVRPGLPGCKASHTLGSLVLVTFVDCDPARPVVVGFDDAESLGYLPTELDLCDGLGRVLREGDTLTLTGVQTGAGATGVRATVTLGLGAPPSPSRVYA